MYEQATDRAQPVRVLMGMLLATMACASVPPVQDEIPGGAAVEFVNESRERVEVFVVVPAVDAVHLSIAMPGERRVFGIPENVLRRGNGNVSFLAVIPALQRRRTSGPVATAKGDSVRVILPLGAAQLIVDRDR